MEALMPGLPDDMARECLVRVPFDCFAAVGSVCKRWKQELFHPSFHHLRRCSGNVQPLVLLIQIGDDPVPGGTRPPFYRFTLLEPTTGAWQSLPSYPRDRGLPLFFRVSPLATELVVVSGWDTSARAATNEVHVYDFLSAAWRRGCPLPGPKRSFFACAASADRRTVFVAGGHDERNNALRSAMAYDARRDTWTPLPDMAREHFVCRGLVFCGRFVVFGGYEAEGHFGSSGSAEEFDAGGLGWVPATDGKGERPSPDIVPAGSRAVYRCTGRKVEIMDCAVGREWRSLPELPSGLKMLTHTMTWGENGVMVLGRSGGRGAAPLVYVLEGTTSAWKAVEVPEEYQGCVIDACCIEI